MLRSLHALREINTLRSTADGSAAARLEAEQASRRDTLTGVYNRDYVEQCLTREFDHARRHKWPLSIALVDLDDFQSINDSFGAQAGDQVLQGTARILRAHTRETDMIARHGGEQFIIMLPSTDAHTAHAICERIVMAFRNNGHVTGFERIPLTVSVGCATHDADQQFSHSGDLLAAARQALHIAKLRGRNRSVPFTRHSMAALAGGA